MLINHFILVRVLSSRYVGVSSLYQVIINVSFATLHVLIIGLSLLLGLLVYPLGLQSEEIRTVCGPHAGSYSLGTWELRWVFVLAIIAFCDAVILGTNSKLLYFTLVISLKQVLPSLSLQRLLIT